jgi:hypothetical protein
MVEVMHMSPAPMRTALPRPGGVVATGVGLAVGAGVGLAVGAGVGLGVAVGPGVSVGLGFADFARFADGVALGPSDGLTVDDAATEATAMAVGDGCGSVGLDHRPKNESEAATNRTTAAPTRSLIARPFGMGMSVSSTPARPSLRYRHPGWCQIDPPPARCPSTRASGPDFQLFAAEWLLVAFMP